MADRHCGHCRAANIAWWSLGKPHATPFDSARPRITIATPTQIGAATVRIGMDQKFLEKRGPDVVARPFTLEKQTDTVRIIQ
ncbi:MAG: hypothetical protein V4858_13740 [Pseudomonadota bacterium]